MAACLLSFDVLAWVRFDQPAWLAVSALVVGPWLVLAWARRRGRSLPVWAPVLQSLALLLLAATLARPMFPTDSSEKPWLILEDVSASVRGQSDVAALDEPDLPAERYVFASSVARDTAAVDANDTDLSAALELAGGRLGELSGVVVLTDGRSGGGGDRWRARARQLAGGSAEVIVSPLVSPVPDARISNFHARREPAGVTLRVNIGGNASRKRTLTVCRVWPSPASLLVRELDLLARQPATVVVRDQLPPDQAATYVAELSPGDRLSENDRAEAAVLPRAGKVAVFGRPLPEAWRILLDANEPTAPAGKLPDDPARLAGFSSLVLVDASGEAFTAAQRRAVAAYVRSGGGLVMIGAGPHASPADASDALSAALPLVVNPWQRRPLQVAVLLDASGSMSQTVKRRGESTGQRKFDIAAEATLSLRRHLTDRDGLAVIAFAAEPDTLYDSNAARVDFDALARRLRAVKPAGTTDLGPALEQALSLAVPEDRHGLILVLSDLMTRPLDAAKLAGEVSRSGRKLAVIATGSADQGHPGAESLVQLVERADAWLVRRETLADVARLFSRFVRRARGDAVREGEFALRAAGEVFGVRASDLPAVEAYMPAAERDGAETLIGTGGGDPVLARQRIGLGRSVALVVPAEGIGQAAEGSQRLGAILAGAVRWAARPPGDPRVDATFTREGNRLTVELTALDNGPISDLQPTLTLRPVGADESETAVAPMEIVGPGRYRCRVEAPPKAAAAVIRDRDGAVLYRQAIGRTYPPEFSAIGPDDTALRELADLSGGRIVAPNRLGAVLRARRQEALWPAWPVTLAAALAAVLLDWALTRVTLGRTPTSTGRTRERKQT
jgi:hypothetical protein